MTNENNCVLADGCKAAGTDACTRHCTHFIAMHGASGEGGRSGAAGLPREYRLVTLQNSPARGDQAEAYKAAYAYASTFNRQFDQQSGSVAAADRIKSLYLVSESPGTGKTTTAAALLNEWLRVHYSGSLRRGLEPLQRPAYFLDVNAWQNDYNEFNRPRVPDSVAEPAAARYYRALEAAKAAPFAVLDDIGVRDATDGFRGDLHTVINARVTNQLPTIYTSNIALDQLWQVFGERRLADRVGDLCREIEFVGESKRGMRR
ncbi:DNA replication protein [Bacillus velezensis]|uniref:DNA replication protein n=1 Tax=Bacillus velezensis TaxID=492670 RepID=UPI000CF10174|nr:DNA replication protein [Bacillus velezensis]MCM3276326.1 DNA replication protein [Bacillus velezensis]MCM3350126.1 DNA replication protein [Bacillus velezensis]MCY7682076.1 DNA replication protein [Bacillus velezensis]PQB13145.1 DNA replication protein [Bacillus velezensis]